MTRFVQNGPTHHFHAEVRLRLAHVVAAGGPVLARFFLGNGLLALGQALLHLHAPARGGGGSSGGGVRLC